MNVSKLIETVISNIPFLDLALIPLNKQVQSNHYWRSIRFKFYSPSFYLLLAFNKESHDRF